jgi:CubicO group peptidase (beta-lactamase class C family)
LSKKEQAVKWLPTISGTCWLWMPLLYLTGVPLLAGPDLERLKRIDSLVDEALRRGHCCGAVVLVTQRFQPIWFKAYGYRQLEPTAEPMTIDTIFDMASLTKVMATASSVLLLAERGLVDLQAPVARHLPEFGQNNKDRITVEQLLRHYGGLVADNTLEDYEGGPEIAWQKICALEPVSAPGTRFLYSDVGYLVLGVLVERVSGETLDRFAKRYFYDPLDMKDTGYWVPEEKRARCAPTEKRLGQWLRGVVHDPRAYRWKRPAGHAGLFSTATDTATFAHMILNKGRWNGVQVLRPETIEQMVSPGATPEGQQRGLGWDMDTPYSRARGAHFPKTSFGHTGFTGTSLWIDPHSQTVVIILANRLHPDGQGDVGPLRYEVASVVAEAVGYAGKPSQRTEPGSPAQARGSSPTEPTSKLSTKPGR